MNEIEYEVEFGTNGNLSSFYTQCTLVDSKGKKILCQCGKSANGVIYGKESFKGWCNECGPTND